MGMPREFTLQSCDIIGSSSIRRTVFHVSIPTAELRLSLVSKGDGVSALRPPWGRTDCDMWGQEGQLFGDYWI
jgi:hypothetical protein